MQGTMKCGVYYGVKNVGIEERPIPQITSKDVLVKVLRAGICGSDTGAYNGGGLPYGIFPECLSAMNLWEKLLKRARMLPMI